MFYRCVDANVHFAPLELGDSLVPPFYKHRVPTGLKQETHHLSQEFRVITTMLIDKKDS